MSYIIYASGCNQRFYEYDSFVCVCNENGCDEFAPVVYPSRGVYKVITSSRDEFRFEETTSNFSDVSGGSVKIFVNTSDTLQTMLGFGGAFTDSTGIGVTKLSSALQEEFAKQYFSTNGIEYNLGRVPIGGSDFSTHPYSYDDFEGDVELTNFSLTFEDFDYKIPLMKAADDLSEKEFLFLATPWAPPSWMKTNGMFNGSGKLIPEMQQPWANYFVKFFDSYKQEGINFHSFTVQNEPFAGTTDYGWNCCHFNAEDEKVFVRDYLGPTLQASGYDGLKLIIGDASHEDCSTFVDGIAVHWYEDKEVPASVLTLTHNDFPDKFLLYTESCNGTADSGNHVHLGSWARGENYAEDIIEVFGGLESSSGSRWRTELVQNNVDAPVIVNETANEFYKQPMFYALGHFSKFIPEGTVHVGSSITLVESIGNPVGGIDASSFVRSDGYIITVVLNTNTEATTVLLEDDLGNQIQHDLPPKSIQTFIYTNEVQK
ncbi:putative glucosylceramidase 4 [Armadillidium nasatum]|uniref:Glucosylceramidase n=1 Tax=Armadillidium nasatum TaxID=96803 RepID=A0A5N5STZ2_9CRUS|nr:putative glucosylceramidase 4 [Armadillidium nasatum]